MVTNTQTNQNMQLLSAKQLAKILSLSKRQVFRLNSCGKIPAPLRIGGSVRWVEAEIYAWINSNPSCPDRQTWEAMKMAAES
mgnify:CR=1 FL=1